MFLCISPASLPSFGFCGLVEKLQLVPSVGILESYIVQSCSCQIDAVKLFWHPCIVWHDCMVSFDTEAIHKIDITKLLVVIIFALQCCACLPMKWHQTGNCKPSLNCYDEISNSDQTSEQAADVTVQKIVVVCKQG